MKKPILYLNQCSIPLVNYLFAEIIPRYAKFDKAHKEEHAWQVITGSLELAVAHNVNLNMSLTIAAFHDLGLDQGRDLHHVRSGELLLSDEKIKQWFTLEQLEVMQEAIEDHRASNKHEPRSIYGKIVAESDRIIDCEVTLRRTLQYGLKHYPELSMREQYERFKLHIVEKYGPYGYLKLWLELPKNVDGLAQIRTLLNDEVALYEAFTQLWNQEHSAT